MHYARTVALTLAFALLAVSAQEKLQRQQNAPTPPTPKTPLAQTSSAPPPAPITFSDPDGQELILESLDVRTAIHGMLSLTELELRFRNPQSRRIEGRFTCTLPPNAAISRFAKEVNGQLMEGEVVERLRANQVYEQFLHQMRDPALLEQDQGNRFSARIFPIEANAPVRLLLSYTTLLPAKNGVRTYTLPLRGMSKVNKLTFRGFVTPIPGEAQQGKLTTSTAQVTSFEERDWTPDRDIVLTSRDERTGPLVLRAGDFYLAALRPRVTASQSAATGNWLFYVDTSASGAEGAEHRIRALESLFAALPANDRVQVLAFDNDVMPLLDGSASELSRTIGARLRTRLFLGGTDLAAMLRDLSTRVGRDASLTAVVVSDLVATLGNTSPNDIRSIRFPANARVHAVLLGSREDSATAKAITAGRGRIVRVPFTESLTSLAADAAEDLRRPLGATVDFDDPNAEWLHPRRVDDVVSGDEVLVLGKVKAGQEPMFGGERAMRLDAATFGPLLEREAYRAYLEHLAEREANEKDEGVRRALANEQVRISVEQRVVIPRTTMLVLETEWDYRRFGLDRRALAAILTIEAGGIGRVDRRQEIAFSTPLPVPPPMPVPMPRATNAPQTEAMKERITVTAEAPAIATPSAPANVDFIAEAHEEIAVSSGVVGGVEGGVVGGSVATNVADAPLRVPPAEPAPPPPPPPAVPRTGLRRDRRADGPVVAAPASQPNAWWRVTKPSRARIAELEADLRDKPRDRELYNQLSEALAANEEWSSLRKVALQWQPYDPENPQVYEILGLAASSLGNETEAARAFASLIEIAPAKTELLQRAGLLLLGAHRAKLAETPLRKALEVRPDRANGYRHLALMLWRDGRPAEAAAVLESATRQTFPGWYGNVQRVIREELGYVYRAWMAKEPSRKTEIEDRAREYNVDLNRTDALRVTLAWETDANDVDLHVVDPAEEEAYYAHRDTKSGLTLYEDITQGLGPEVIRTSRVVNGTYHLGVRYFAAGPMGISRGVVIVMRNDDVQIHPFRLVQGGGDIRYVASLRVK
jgi:tetratricopeptide (TPR) repeat protein